jgi:nucleoside 2-deoxyribosyltransferase
MMPNPRIYLAGPDVFLPEAGGLAEKKKRICSDSGFEGVFPADRETELSRTDRPELGWQISQKNENLIRSCDLLIANMTPFRGVSMDAGTAFEIGFMRALGRPVLGYTNSTDDYFRRVQDWMDGPGKNREPDGTLIEDYGFAENLMIEGAVHFSGGEVERSEVSDRQQRFTDLRGFIACVEKVASLLKPE